MRMLLAGVIVVAVGGEAGAQEEPESAEAMMHPMDIGFEPMAGRWSVQAHGQLVAAYDGAGGGASGLAAGLDIAREHEACTLVRAGGRASLMGERDATAEQWVSACIMGGFPLPSVTMENHLSLWVTPHLSARRRTLAVPQSSNAFSVRMAFVDLHLGDFDPVGEGQHIIVARVGLTVTSSRQYAGPAGSGAAAPAPTGNTGARISDDHVEMTMAVDTIAYADDEGRGVDIFAIEIASYAPPMPPAQLNDPNDPTPPPPPPLDPNADSRSVDLIDFVPLRLTGMGSGRLRWDAVLGWGSASAYTADAPIDPMTGLAIARYSDDFLTGRFALRHGTPRLTTGLELTRDAWPTLDDAVALEERATLSSSGQRGRWSWAARAFAARTTVTEIPDAIGASAPPPTTASTGGGDARLTVRLGRHANATLATEVARSFYAVPGSDALVPAWGARAFASLGASWGR